MTGLLPLFRRFRAHRRGSVAVEMALCFPIIGFVSLNIMDLCVYIFSRMQTELAAQAAVGKVRNLCPDAKLPATYPTGNCSATLSTDMAAAAQATSLGSSVTLNTPTEAYYCADDSGGLQLVAAIDATPPADCSTVVTGSTQAPGDYISVTASYTYVPFAPGLTIMSALSTNIQQTAWMRLK
ncbi:TadE/TadG family type IV pilus assembly protein [Sphingobium sp. TCM1]|uniref:TadE/TadG family type IV pilus assembly protein n=1 Tax=Sphingobium sp. TCM1 TaxID=453246 RepID=UPI0008373DA7|nr:TadE/TadG family type IV pilus assembly protein [Sphingobium sp. TCM1]